MIAVQQQVVRARDARGAGADDGDAHLRRQRLLHHLAVELQRRGPLLLVGDEALERLDADRFVDQVAAARHLAEAHAHAAARRGHRVLLQDHAERVPGLAVAHVVDVARHVHARRTRLDAGRGQVGHAVLARARRFRALAFEHVAEVAQRAEQRDGARAAEPAEAGLGHLHAERLDLVERERRAFAAANTSERLAHERGAHAARRALCRTTGRFCVEVVPERVGQVRALVEDEESAIAEERANGIAVVELLEVAKLRPFRHGLRRASTMIVDDPRPHTPYITRAISLSSRPDGRHGGREAPAYRRCDRGTSRAAASVVKRPVGALHSWTMRTLT